MNSNSKIKRNLESIGDGGRVLLAALCSAAGQNTEFAATTEIKSFPSENKFRFQFLDKLMLKNDVDIKYTLNYESLSGIRLFFESLFFIIQ
jgi:hypothetical protein